jgi:hypothetical protein
LTDKLITIVNKSAHEITFEHDIASQPENQCKIIKGEPALLRYVNGRWKVLDADLQMVIEVIES